MQASTNTSLRLFSLLLLLLFFLPSLSFVSSAVVFVVSCCAFVLLVFAPLIPHVARPAVAVVVAAAADGYPFPDDLMARLYALLLL